MRFIKVMAAGLAGALLVAGLMAGVADAATRKKKGGIPKNTPLTFHEEVWGGGRVFCFKDHYHYGSSGPQASRKAAEAAAIQSWADFVSFEYGNAYGNFKIAQSKGMNCSESGGSWSCSLEARPCHVN